MCHSWMLSYPLCSPKNWNLSGFEMRYGTERKNGYRVLGGYNYGLDQWFPTFFFQRAIYFISEGMGATRSIFLHPPPLLFPLLPSLPTARGFGGALKDPPAGSGAEPQPTTHFRAFYGKKVIVLTCCDRFSSVQSEIFRFSPRISYFHHNWHNGSNSTGLLCQNGKFYSFCTYIFKIL